MESDNPFRELGSEEENNQGQEEEKPENPNPGNVFNENAHFVDNTKEETNEDRKHTPMYGNQIHSSSKYHIRDLFWLINPKLENREGLYQNEPGLVTITYNADFDNMKFAFYKVNPDVFKRKGAVILNNAQQVTIFNLHSETCSRIVYEYNRAINGELEEALKDQDRTYITIKNFERVFNENQNWTPNITSILINKDGQIVIGTVDNQSGNKFKYNFKGWQIESLISACKFMSEGGSFQTGMMRRIFGL